MEVLRVLRFVVTDYRGVGSHEDLIRDQNYGFPSICEAHGRRDSISNHAQRARLRNQTWRGVLRREALERREPGRT